MNIKKHIAKECWDSKEVTLNVGELMELRDAVNYIQSNINLNKSLSVSKKPDNDMELLRKTLATNDVALKEIDFLIKFVHKLTHDVNGKLDFRAGLTELPDEDILDKVNMNRAKELDELKTNANV